MLNNDVCLITQFYGTSALPVTCFCAVCWPELWLHCQPDYCGRDYSENDILLAHKNTLPFLHTTLAKVGRGHLLEYSICLVDTPLPPSFAIFGFLEER